MAMEINERAWHREVINPQVERAVHDLQASGVLDRFYLAEGTGLALQFGHRRSQDLDFWMQFYNLGIDEATKSNSAVVTYQITDSSGTVILQKQLDSKDLGQHSDQLTVENSLPIAGLEPGKYNVVVKLDDAISKQQIAQSAPFVVE